MLYDEGWSIWVKALDGCFFIFNILLIYKKKPQPTAVDESRVVMIVIHSPINQLDGAQLLCNKYWDTEQLDLCIQKFRKCQIEFTSKGHWVV